MKKSILLRCFAAAALFVSLTSCSLGNGSFGSNMDKYIPEIGENGNWWVNGVDTGKPAIPQPGKDGENGKDGEPGKDGENGKDGLDGKDGQNGENGKSAFEVFKESHPEYTGDEAQWLADMANGSLVDLTNYEVKFEDGFGNPYDTLNAVVISGQLASKPVDPTMTKKVFLGWFNKETGEKWNFGSNPIFSDLILEAHWASSSEVAVCFFESVSASKTSVTFSLHKNEIATPKSINLYDKNKELVQTLTDFENLRFENLLTGTKYTLEVNYSFDYNDGNGEKTDKSTATFTTGVYNLPSASLNNVSSTKNSISFDTNKVDYNGICSLKSIKLYKGEESVAELEDLSERVFTNLNANTRYTLKVIYSYDMHDGFGEKEIVLTNDITTDSYSTPVIAFSNRVVTQNKISGSLSVSDKDNVSTINSIKLMKGETVVTEHTDLDNLDLLFEDLNSNSEYTVNVNYTYDLFDGDGEHNENAIFNLRTHPSYSLSSTSILNTTSIAEGDTVFLHAKVLNPSNSTFVRVKINGEYYNVSAASNSTDIYVSFPTNEGGNMNFEISEIVSVLDGQEFTFMTENNNSANATVLRKLKFNKWSVGVIDRETNQFIEQKYRLIKETGAVKISIYNPDDYVVNKVIISGEEYSGDSIETIDSSNIVVKLSRTYSHLDTEYLSIGSIVCEKDGIEKEFFVPPSVPYAIQNIFRYDESDHNSIKTYEISTIEDFQKIGNEYLTGSRYVLTNDLDFSNVSNRRIFDLEGLFDGNGHTISGLNFVSNIENKTVLYGLFDTVRGIVKNLNISDSKIFATLGSSSGIRAGFISASMVNSEFENIVIDSSCSILVQRNQSSPTGYVSGISAGGSYSTFKNCVNKANIDVEGEYLVGAGISCINQWGEYYSCGNSGNVQTNPICTFDKYDSYTLVLDNCWNTGMINSDYGFSFESMKRSDGKYLTLNNSIDLSLFLPNQVPSTENKTYSFNSMGGSEIDDIVCSYAILPTPTRKGYIFLGWYDNDPCEGNCYKETYYTNDSSATLYAKWVERIDPKSLVSSNNSQVPFVFNEKDQLVLDITNATDSVESKCTFSVDSDVHINLDIAAYNASYTYIRIRVNTLDGSRIYIFDRSTSLDVNELVSINLFAGESMIISYSSNPGSYISLDIEAYNI